VIFKRQAHPRRPEWVDIQCLAGWEIQEAAESIVGTGADEYESAFSLKFK
jgi:hypothetical protein